MEFSLWFVLAILAGVIVWIIAIYNSLVRARTRTREGYADIEVQLKRRYDLIPNLVKTVQAYAKHESGLFEKVTQARSAAVQTTDVAKKAQAENALSATLKSLFAVAENYPDLKATQNFSQLQDELADTENKIHAARRFYNSMARDYNIKIEVFPNSLFAQVFHFVQVAFFEIDKAEEREAVKVNF